MVTGVWLSRFPGGGSASACAVLPSGFGDDHFGAVFVELHPEVSGFQAKFGLFLLSSWSLQWFGRSSPGQ